MKEIEAQEAVKVRHGVPGAGHCHNVQHVCMHSARAAQAQLGALEQNQVALLLAFPSP